MEKLRRLYKKFLNYRTNLASKDLRFWFGVDKLNVTQKEIQKKVKEYYSNTFLDFLRRVRDIIFCENPLFLIKNWSEDQWLPFYYLSFLKKEGVIKIEKSGKIKLLKKELLKIFPKKRKEEEIKEIVEKKLKTKLDPEAFSNFPFKTEIFAQYDQFPISISSAIFIVKKILDYLPLNKKFLFVGDDDFISVYLSLAEPKIECLVVDIDEKILGKIQEISKKFGLKIETKKVDISKVKKLNEKFIGFSANPVYTFEGIKTFLDFGVNQLGEDGGFVFLSVSDEAVGNRILFLEEFFVKKKLKVEEVIKEKVYYPFALVHPEDKILFERWRKFFNESLIKKSPMIGASLWIFEYIPFKIKRPKKQLFYAYL
jgi:predicted methyltransferase